MRNAGALSKLLLRGSARSAILQQPQRLTTHPHDGALLHISRSCRSTYHNRAQGDPGSSKAVTVAIGTLTLSFAASSLSSVAWAKERVPSELAPKEVILYQYEACPFCNKVKAFLDYHDIPYRVVEVNPMSKSELKWSEYKKVPVLLVDGEQLNDSTEIITRLDRKIKPQKVVDPAAQEEEEKWRSWVDDHLVHMLSPNIYRTIREALEAFEYITTNGNFTPMERAAAKYGGAVAMYYISKKLKRRHRIIDARYELYSSAQEWVEALDGRTFMGGTEPNLADLAVFGVLRPIRHLRAGRDMVENTDIGAWYSEMEKAVGASSRLKDDIAEAVRQPVTETLRE